MSTLGLSIEQLAVLPGARDLFDCLVIRNLTERISDLRDGAAHLDEAFALARSRISEHGWRYRETRLLSIGDHRFARLAEIDRKVIQVAFAVTPAHLVIATLKEYLATLSGRVRGDES